MAIIINRSPHALGIIGPIPAVKAGEPLLPPNFSMVVDAADSKTRAPFTATIPDAVAEFWASKDPGKALIAEGLVEIKLQGKTKPAAKEDVATDVVHWRTAIANVKTMESLDALEALHAEETRPHVVQAIESRMEELNA